MLACIWLTHNKIVAIFQAECSTVELNWLGSDDMNLLEETVYFQYILYICIEKNFFLFRQAANTKTLNDDFYGMRCRGSFVYTGGSLFHRAVVVFRNKT